MNSDPFFQEIFQELPVPTIILQANVPDFIIIEVNELFLNLNNRSREELQGKGFFGCGPHPAMSMESVAKTRESLNQVVQEKILVRSAIQKFTQYPAGSEASGVYYLQATNKPVLDKNNEIKYIVRSLKDVTETVTTQIKEFEINKILAINEKFLKDTQRIARIGSWEIDQNYYVRWSDIHYEIFETEEDFQPTLENSLAFLKDKRNKEKFLDIFNEAVASGKAFDEEFEIVTAKGNSRWLCFTGKGEMREGVFVRLYGTAQDITSRKVLELQLVDSRNHFENLIQTIQGVVWEADAETLKMAFISEQITGILGYTKEECLSDSKFWQNHLHPEDKEEVIKYTLAQIKRCSHFSYDYRMLKKDGSYAWLQASFSVICENGQPKWIRGLMIDATSSKLFTDVEHLEKTVLELNSTPNVPLPKVLEIYIQGIENIFPEMICAIMQVKNGHVHNWVSHSLPTAYEATIENQPIGEKAGSCGTAAFRKQMVIVSDIATDPLWEEYKEGALKEGLHACWSYPIVSSAGEVMATLAMYYPTVTEPTEEELKVVARTAAILTVIIENRHNSTLLEETNFLMKQSQELAHFGNIHWDLLTNKLTWSKELYAIFGLEPESEITFERHLESIIPEDRERIKQEVSQLLTGKKDRIFEERIHRPNGEIRYLRTWSRVMVNEQKEPIKVIGACLDITESKQTEERLIASEKRLRNIMDSQTNYVIRIDLNKRYTYTNKKFIEDFALNGQDSLIGLNFLKTIRGDQQQKVKEVIRQCIAHPNRVFPMELEKKISDHESKSTFWHFICLTDLNGNPHEIQGIAIDISERKRAEEERKLKTLELEESEKRYSDLFHLSPQPMWVFEMDSLRFIDVNKAAIKLYGYSKEEFLSMTVKEIRPMEEIPKLVEDIISIQESNIDFYRRTYTHTTKEGDKIQVDVNSNLIPSKGEKARLVLASNITERMNYLNALELQNKKLREIAWIQSHVVRAPLARIMGLIDIIQNHPELNFENMDLLRHILNSAEELDKIIREIANKAKEVGWDTEGELN